MERYDEVIDGSLATQFDRITNYTYSFDMEDLGLSYMVAFDQPDPSLIEVSFKAFKSEDDDHIDTGTHDQISIGFRAAATVFHTVYAILKDFLDTSEDPIDYVEFGAKTSEPSRVKFYRTLAYQLAKAYGQDPTDIDIHEGTYDREGEMLFTVPVMVDPDEDEERLQEKIDPARALPFELVHTATMSESEYYTYEFVSPDQPEDTYYVANISIDERLQYLDVDFEINEFGVGVEEMEVEERYGLRDVGIKVAMQVFNTMAAILNDVLTRTNIDVLFVTFSAKSDETSRVKFYHTLAVAMAKEQGYTADDIQVDESHGEHVFIIPLA